VTRGIELLDLVGLEFAVGSVRLRGAGRCSPCRYIEDLTRPGLLQQLSGRGGLRTIIVEGGLIHVGDEIRILGLGDAS
jgi:MOSC domain-containing protein YiiM